MHGSSDAAFAFVFLVAVYFSWACCAAYVATIKGRSPGEGAVLSLFLGPLASVVVAMLPTKASAPAPKVPAERPDYRHTPRKLGGQAEGS